MILEPAFVFVENVHFIASSTTVLRFCYTLSAFRQGRGFQIKDSGCFCQGFAEKEQKDTRTTKKKVMEV